MSKETEPHDVFISYAREDSDWVRQNLYAPLQKCRTAYGLPPRIFFDVGEDGIQIGEDFQAAIDLAIEKAHKFVPVYSATYFRKEMCLTELRLARSRDCGFQQGLLLPIVIDDTGADQIPFAYRTLNYLSVNTDREWFGKLAKALGLRHSSEVLALQFCDQPGDVFVNHTLPVVRVAFHADGATSDYDDEITISAERGRLLGTTTIRTCDGIASFADLSIADIVGETRLIARSSRVARVESDPFTVFSRADLSHTEPAIPGQSGHVTISATGEAVFFETGRHVSVIQPRRLSVFSIDGKVILNESVALRPPVHLVRRSGGRLVLADLHGNVSLVCDDGRYREWRFGESVNGFVVPADVDIDHDDIYVSFWSGSVFRLRDSGEAEHVLKDDGGIQALAVYGNQLFTCDFSGNLRTYRNGRLVNTAIVEPVIRSLMGTPTCLVGVGDRRFYHISPDEKRVIDLEMPLSNVASVYELSERPIVIDVDGKGIRFDTNLVITATVYTQPGAEPVSADNEGKYCVFRNPDATRTLLVRDRIVFSHAQGCLAISPLGDLFAIGDESTIRLYSSSEFQELIGRENEEVEQLGQTPRG